MLCAAAISVWLAGGTPTAHADDGSPLSGLINAAAQRLQTAEPVAAIKWKTNGSIEDPPRVQQVLTAVSADARQKSIDADYISRIFADQINATEAVEYSRFAQWKLDPANIPAAPPDLSASRATIDALNREMVDQIAANWQLLHSPACAGEVENARNAVSGALQLDALYQQALRFATRSYCPA